MAQAIQYSQENLPKLKTLVEELKWEQGRVARLATALGLRLFPHEQACAHQYQRSSETQLHDIQLDPEQNQLRPFRLLVEQRAGRTMDQSEANDHLSRYLDLGIGRLHDAWIGRDQDKYKLFAYLRDLLAYPSNTDSLLMPVSSCPELLLGSDANGRPLTFRPTIEGGYRNAAHLAVVGASGVGKTQGALALLDQTLEQATDAGCLILDYKGDITRTEQAFLKRHGFEVYAAGRSPALPLNPLFLPEAANPALAAESLADHLGTINHLGQVQQLLLRDAAKELFESRDQLFQPTLALLKETVLRRYAETGKKNTADKAVKLVSDLADFNLFQGESGLDPATFLSRRIVLDFGQEDAFRDLIAFLTLQYLINGMRLLGDAPVASNPDGSRNRALRSILFIDEAQNYLKADARPLYKIVREARSFGVAVWLSTQTLADFDTSNDDLTTNLSTWLIFSPGGSIPPAAKLAGLLRINKSEAEGIVTQLSSLGNGECYANVDGHPKRIHAVQLWNKANWPALTS